MIAISQVFLPLAAGLEAQGGKRYTAGPVVLAVAKRLALPVERIAYAEVVHRSIDARKKMNVHFIATIQVSLLSDEDERRAVDAGRAAWAKPPCRIDIECVSVDDSRRPVVIGTGPAGLFCALYLARAGARPVVIERGEAAEARARSVESFYAGAPLNVHSNIQFGEGGAGTFSDGKLTTNTKHPLAPVILEWFVEAGAPSSILWEAKPHIGSDYLPSVVAHMRREIIRRGGEVRFGWCATDLRFHNGYIQDVELSDAMGHKEYLAAHQVVLACGHSARDTFEMLRVRGMYMEQKPFSLGVRIEHPQGLINASQWGNAAEHPALGAAPYKMAAHITSTRSAYTFCMCPGGVVVAAASEEGGVVTNGMSNYARDGFNANAALLVNVEPSDFGSSDVLAGIELQRSIERAAYQATLQAGALPYTAPMQCVGSFLDSMQHVWQTDIQALSRRKQKGSERMRGRVPNAARTRSANRADAAQFDRFFDAAQKRFTPTYPRGVHDIELTSIFPDWITETMAQALLEFDRKLAGFADRRALMTAPETRSSSPVRIVRDRETLQGHLCGNEVPSGVYPCGEGAGYAGGIMSAAADGMRVAQAVLKEICQHRS